MSDQRTVPLFVRPGGRAKVAGVRAALKPGDGADAASATWLLEAGSLAGHVPRAGDRLRGTDGVWWVVREALAPAGGAFPCVCDREPE